MTRLPLIDLITKFVLEPKVSDCMQNAFNNRRILLIIHQWLSKATEHYLCAFCALVGCCSINNNSNSCRLASLPHVMVDAPDTSGSACGFEKGHHLDAEYYIRLLEPERGIRPHPLIIVFVI